jgi:mRNA interferase YafQ
MYFISRTKDFEKSYKKIKDSGKLKRQVRESLMEAIDMLARGEILPPGYKDHQLRGELKQYRECHIKGDLLLVYQIRKKELLLILVNIGTHSYFDF